MSNILFLTSQYTGTVGANGICTRNIIAELTRKGHCVSVLCYDNGVAETDVYTFSVQHVNSKSNVGSKIIKAIGALFVPVLDKEKEQCFIDMTMSICEERKIDMIVCMFFPLETVSVLKVVKERFPDITTIIYELDSVGDGIFAASKFHYFAKLAYERWGSSNYCYADKVIIMKSHEAYWKRVWGNLYGEKLLIADIPVLTEHFLPHVERGSELPISLLYGGLLGRKYRSPEHLLSVFNLCSQKTRIFLDFYSKGDCEEVIASFAQSNPYIRQHGYVPADVLDEAIARTDILVSIGNSVSRSVPSKLITYFSYGKPVIHLSSQKDDVCVQYLEQYPLGLVLNEWESVEENACKLYSFIKKVQTMTVEFSEVANTMWMNTPLYSAELIEDAIINSCCN